jgi:hypothetical protein
MYDTLYDMKSPYDLEHERFGLQNFNSLARFLACCCPVASRLRQVWDHLARILHLEIVRQI